MYIIRFWYVCILRVTKIALLSALFVFNIVDGFYLREKEWDHESLMGLSTVVVSLIFHVSLIVIML